MRLLRPDRHPPVLLLGPRDAEWLPAGEREAGAAVSCDVRRPHELAGAARAAFEEAERAAGRKPGRRAPQCVLALGRERVAERLVELPALTPRERRDVLRRKAASLVGCTQDEVLFSASLQTRPPESKRGEAPDRWLIVAVRRSEAEELCRALLVRGMPVARVVSARLAAPREALARRRPAPGHGLVVVAVEPSSTTVSLTIGDALVSQSTLAGNLGARPRLARALLQEVRGLDAHMRKTYRKSGVREIAWIGLGSDKSEPLRAALQSALPDAEVHPLDGRDGPTGSTPEAEPGADAEAGLAPGRARLLAACRRTAGFVLDLPLSRPRSAAAKASWFVGTLAVVALVGLGLRARLQGRLSELERDLDRLELRETVVGPARERAAEARAGIDELRAQLVRIDDASRAALPFGSVVEDALSAFADDGALASLSFRRERGDGSAPTHTEVVLTGWADADPLRGARSVEAIVAALETSASIAEVRVEPPTSLPQEDGVTRPLAFTLRARTDVEPSLLDAHGEEAAR